MNRYRINLKRSVVKELDDLSPRTHSKIIEHFRQLEEDPRLFGAEKLTGIDAYKLRVGNLRIIYSIDILN